MYFLKLALFVLPFSVYNKTMMFLKIFQTKKNNKILSVPNNKSINLKFFKFISLLQTFFIEK